LSVRLAGVRLLRRPLAAGGIGTAPGFREGMIQARNMPKVVGGSFAWGMCGYQQRSETQRSLALGYMADRIPHRWLGG
jgi:hypothetical protein